MSSTILEFISSLDKLHARDRWLLQPENYIYSFIVVALYLLLVVYLLPRLFRDRKPVTPKSLIALWNFGLFAFSLCSALASAYFSVRILVQHGGDLSGLICDNEAQLWSGLPMLVSYLFLISKYVELGGNTRTFIHRVNPLR
jgi:hypothetical protein